jgi:hypothetical protein
MYRWVDFTWNPVQGPCQHQRDLLSEYLDSEAVREAFQAAAGNRAIHVFIPEENRGPKKYNGVCWWYWIRHRFMHGYFRAHCDGYTYTNSASSVGGCAPAFRVLQEEKA